MRYIAKILLVLSVVLIQHIALAQTCNDTVTSTTPDERFIDRGDGTVQDKHTGLIWMRCALGQTWDGSTCTGNAATYTWQQALQAAADTTYAGSSAWQLPNIKQLTNIVEESCYDPAINLNLFPATPSSYFWSASPYASGNDFAWGVYFRYGDGYGSYKSSYGSVRLVRPGATDDDGDGIADEADNCPLHVNVDQLDTDGDGEGDACDTDDDNDGIPDEEDDNPLTPDAVTVTITGQIENGTISPSETQIINKGKTIEFTVTADAGYIPFISGCDGSWVGTEFTIDPVVDNCAITLSFKLPAPLNDTGITRCGNETDTDLDCPQVDFPEQDAEFGRDVTHNDDSDGHAGFSFTKIDANGNELPASAAQWSCVKDNITGLIWEVKTDDGGLRDRDHSYTWYNSDSNTNGGNAGTENGGTCVDTVNCDTEKYVVRVNEVGLCGYNDWRMPNKEQLRSIVNYATNNPAIDASYFPNTRSSNYWTASPYAISNGYAWHVNFDQGYGYNYYENHSYHVRLVRPDSN